jgi:hypothetical protein
VLDMAEKLRFEIYPTPELLRALDRWRGRQDDVPPRAEAARRLLERGLTEEGEYPPPASRSAFVKAPRRAKT